MKVSVVMATFNGAAHVAEQLTSILDGHRPPDELIIIDDRSTDATVDIVRGVLAGRRGIDITLEINPTNAGATSSFLKGIRMTTGDVVLTADQDDRWSQDKIAIMEGVMAKDPTVSMVHSDGTIANARLEPSGATIFNTRRRPNLHLGSQRDPIEIATDPDIKGCTMAVRGDVVRELLSRTPNEVGRYWGHDHWIALFAYGLGKVVALEQPLIQHRIHERNTSGGRRFRPWRPSDWKKWTARIEGQGRNHFSQRYMIALRGAGHYGTRFSSTLKTALEQMLQLSLRREKLKEEHFMARLRGAWSILREGHYHQRYNGLLTFFRDVLL